MNLQKTIMLEYLRLRGNPTLRKMNEDTGIQTTRLFRLMNGAKMRLEEYEVFLQKVMSLQGVSKNFIDLFKESAEKLSKESQEEVERLLEEKLALWHIKQLI